MRFLIGYLFALSILQYLNTRNVEAFKKGLLLHTAKIWPLFSIHPADNTGSSFFFQKRFDATSGLYQFVAEVWSGLTEGRNFLSARNPRLEGLLVVPVSAE